MITLTLIREICVFFKLQCYQHYDYIIHDSIKQRISKYFYIGPQNLELTCQLKILFSNRPNEICFVLVILFSVTL